MLHNFLKKKFPKFSMTFIHYENKKTNLCRWVEKYIWQLKDAINSSIFYGCKKSPNTQIVHKNLHI
jgi:hypothetical protein